VDKRALPSSSSSRPTAGNWGAPTTPAPWTTAPRFLLILRQAADIMSW